MYVCMYVLYVCVWEGRLGHPTLLKEDRKALEAAYTATSGPGPAAATELTNNMRRWPRLGRREDGEEAARHIHKQRCAHDAIQ